jgi:hypothetical protein
MATLIASSKNFYSETMLSHTFNVDKFIESIFRAKTEQSAKIASNRLEIRNGRYMYTPSNEYTNTKAKFIRAKFGR